MVGQVSGCGGAFAMLIVLLSFSINVLSFAMVFMLLLSLNYMEKLQFLDLD